MFDLTAINGAESVMVSAYENNEIVTSGLFVDLPNPTLEYVGKVTVRGPAVNTTLFSELKVACAVKVEASIIAGSGPNQRRDIPHCVTYVGCDAGKGFFELTANIYRG